jgi:hypothetical protein
MRGSGTTLRSAHFETGGRASQMRGARGKRDRYSAVGADEAPEVQWSRLPGLDRCAGPSCDGDAWAAVGPAGVKGDAEVILFGRDGDTENPAVARLYELTVEEAIDLLVATSMTRPGSVWRRSNRRAPAALESAQFETLTAASKKRAA